MNDVSAFFRFSELKAEYAGNEELNTAEPPHLLKVIQAFKANVFNSNVYNQKFGKKCDPSLTHSRHLVPLSSLVKLLLSFAILETLSLCLLLFVFLVNPIASSHSHNAQQQNYSLHPNPVQTNNYDASFNSANNFNNFDQSNQFPMQYQQQQTYDQQQFQGGHVQQQFMGQSSVVGQQQLHQGINNGSASSYQHSINDLLVQPTVTLQQNLFSQEAVTANQSVSFASNLTKMRLLMSFFLF